MVCLLVWEIIHELKLVDYLPYRWTVDLANYKIFHAKDGKLCTVNWEIFVCVLFSRNFSGAKYHGNRTLVKW